MTSQLQFSAIMTPATEGWWWYIGQTAEQVDQLLTKNKAMLREINAYLDTDNIVKFAVVMEPANQAWWWYVGQTVAEISELLTKNKAMLTHVSAYVDTDHKVKLAVVMKPANHAWWWYVGQTAAEVNELLAKNKAMLTAINAYIDTDTTVKFAVIMAPANQAWWWYVGQTAAEVSALLTKNKAMLTDLSAYIDTDNVLKFAVIMAPADHAWWWYEGVTAPQLGQFITKNKAMLTSLSPVLQSVSNSITINFNPNLDEGDIAGHLNGSAALTLDETGACTFSGGWSDSNGAYGLVAHDVSLAIGVRDIRGTLWKFTTSGTLHIESAYTFHQKITVPTIAANWQFLSESYSYHWMAHESLDIGATFNDVLNWFEQNGQTIENVVEVIAAVAA